jgi:hypothetical protein
MPPKGGKSLSMVLNMVVAGVMGYPAKKRHPETTAPQAIASFPSMRQYPILILHIKKLSPKKLSFRKTFFDERK